MVVRFDHLGVIHFGHRECYSGVLETFEKTQRQDGVTYCPCCVEQRMLGFVCVNEVKRRVYGTVDQRHQDQLHSLQARLESLMMMKAAKTEIRRRKESPLARSVEDSKIRIS